ncbi:unnamed protein product [Pocillopora meandrina]|uniref:Uncharacterized protein n=1 Tax=Pocillopora meandrina TaxID=46732 RepID=A0AAU9WCQ5_9CNID|nr:unnamed protein product [Pocillopora meandrina]
MASGPLSYRKLQEMGPRSENRTQGTLMHAMTHALTTQELDVNDRLLSYTDQSSPKCDKMTLLLVGIASLVFLVTSQCLLHV